MSSVEQLIAALGGEAVLLASIAWLIKTLISSGLARDAAAFRAELQRDSEEFKSNLQIEVHRQATVFSRLHEKRAATIAQIYRLLSEAEQAVRSIVAPMQMVWEPDANTKMANSAEAIGKLRDKFEASRIWFKPETCVKADAVLTELRQIHNIFNIAVRGLAGRGNRDVDSAEWIKTWERVE